MALTLLGAAGHDKGTKKAVGLLMLALGLAILTGYDKRLEGFLVNCKLIDNPNLKHTQLIP